MQGMEITMEFYGKRILVIGAGLSGIAAARLLDNIAQVVLYDANEKQKNCRKKIFRDGLCLASCRRKWKTVVILSC